MQAVDGIQSSDSTANEPIDNQTDEQPTEQNDASNPVDNIPVAEEDPDATQAVAVYHQIAA